MVTLAFAIPGNEVVRLDNLQLFIVGAALTGTAALGATLARRALSPA